MGRRCFASGLPVCGVYWEVGPAEAHWEHGRVEVTINLLQVPAARMAAMDPGRPIQGPFSWRAAARADAFREGVGRVSRSSSFWASTPTSGLAANRRSRLATRRGWEGQQYRGPGEEKNASQESFRGGLC